MRKINEENERVKRKYFHWAQNADRKDEKTIIKIASAILRFESSTNFKSFKQFNTEQVVSFKRKLEKETNKKTGKPLSKSTIDGILRELRGFFKWLADQQGYKSRISHSDALYFNNSMKDSRIARAHRNTRYPTMEQALHAFTQMPNETDIERRNKAAFAFLMLTGARIAAITTTRLMHIDLVEECVYQDAREMDTKGSKTFTTWFLPVDQIYWDTFIGWVNYLRNDKLFGNEDALFPKPEMGTSEETGFKVIGLLRDPYSSSSKLRDVIKQAFASAGLPVFSPHTFRKTLVRHIDKICDTREQFKALSLNIGHDDVATTMQAYYPISLERQAEIIRGMRKTA